MNKIYTLLFLSAISIHYCAHAMETTAAAVKPKESILPIHANPVYADRVNAAVEARDTNALERLITQIKDGDSRYTVIGNEDYFTNLLADTCVEIARLQGNESTMQSSVLLYDAAANSAPDDPNNKDYAEKLKEMQAEKARKIEEYKIKLKAEEESLEKTENAILTLAQKAPTAVDQALAARLLYEKEGAQEAARKAEAAKKAGRSGYTCNLL